MKYLITLILTLIILYVYIKESYKYATLPDEVELPIDFEYKQNN